MGRVMMAPQAGDRLWSTVHRLVRLFNSGEAVLIKISWLAGGRARGRSIGKANEAPEEEEVEESVAPFWHCLTDSVAFSELERRPITLGIPLHWGSDCILSALPLCWVVWSSLRGQTAAGRTFHDGGHPRPDSSSLYLGYSTSGRDGRNGLLSLAERNAMGDHAAGVP